VTLSPSPKHIWLFCTVLVLLFGLVSLAFAAQQPKVLAPHRPLAPRLEKRLPWSLPTVRQSATGGLWMTDANWKAALYLKNGLKTDPITVTPILYLSNGLRVPLSPVTLEPSGTTIVDIGKGLESVGIAPYATLCGYAEIEYQWAWAAVTATVKNVDVVNSLIFIFGLQPSPEWHPEHMQSMPGLQATSFEGMWWKQEIDVSGFLALSNVTGKAIHAAVRLTDKTDTRVATYQITVSPHGTKMLTLDELKTVAGDTGGIYLTHDGPERGLDINGGLQDKAVGYSAQLRMRPQPQPVFPAQPQSPETLAISELGLMAGEADPMMRFPSGTVFTPYSLVRNISEQPAAVTPELWWMAGGSPHSATLPQIVVAPHGTVNLDAPALMATAGLKNFNGSVNLILDTKAQAGGLLLSSGSVDQKNTYVFEVMPHGIAEGASKALCYWSTGNGDDTMVTLWNPADEAQDLAFTLFYTGGQYVYPIQLGPRETRAFSISEILRSSGPDAAGNVIPAGILEGSAEVAGALGEHQHILISLDVAVYNIRKATCGTVCWTCNGAVEAAIALNPFGVPVGGTTTETFYETWNTGGQSNPGASWRSSSTSIATVNSGGVVTGVRMGKVTLVATDPYPETEGVGQYCTDMYFTCPTEGFNASTPGDSQPTVTIGAFSQNPILQGNTATVQITVNPSATISLSISSGAGGAANFNGQGGPTTLTISGTTTVTIYGSAPSKSDNDVTLSASWTDSSGNTAQLASSPFSITSGSCTLNNESDSGSGLKTCPSTVTLKSTYTVSQYCATCTFTCVSVHTDGTWTPASGACTSVATHVVGSLTGTATTQATATFSASDCNWHYAYFVTRIVNAQGVITDNTGGSIGLKCTANSNGYPCS
jgi:hypothetical protein